MKNIIEIEKRKDVAEGFCYRYTEEWLVEYEYEDEEIYYTKWISLISSTYNEEEYKKMKIKYETNPLKELGILFENNTILNLHTGEVVDWGNHELKDMIESLGFEMNERIYRIQYENEKHLAYIGQMWDINDDIIMDILYNEFFDDIKGACEVVDMLEEKYGWNIYLYWSIRFRDKETKEERKGE